IYTEWPRVVPRVPQPLSIGGEHRLALDRGRAQEARRGARFPACELIALDGNHHQVSAGLRARLLKGENPSARMPRRGRLGMLAVGQSLRVSRAVGSLPIEIL